VLRRIASQTQRGHHGRITTLYGFPSICHLCASQEAQVDFDGGNQFLDGGLLLLRQAERKLGVCRRLAGAMPNRRDPSRICHDMFEMVTAPISAIACVHRMPSTSTGRDMIR
jgi:hypothetical protein